jgi:ParB-like chromosome segregation protein Spo0J
MPEPRELADARRRLAEAENEYLSAKGLARLVEGLGLLDEVIESGDATHARIARNLASAYAARIFARIQHTIVQDAAVPEPELEHFFQVVLAFDRVRADLPASSSELKVAVVRRLIDRYYEGHPEPEKQRALDMLAQVRPDD